VTEGESHSKNISAAKFLMEVYSLLGRDDSSMVSKYRPIRIFIGNTVSGFEVPYKILTF